VRNLISSVTFYLVTEGGKKTLGFANPWWRHLKV